MRSASDQPPPNVPPKAVATERSERNANTRMLWFFLFHGRECLDLGEAFYRLG